MQTWAWLLFMVLLLSAFSELAGFQPRLAYSAARLSLPARPSSVIRPQLEFSSYDRLFIQKNQPKMWVELKIRSVAKWTMDAVELCRRLWLSLSGIAHPSGTRMAPIHSVGVPATASPPVSKNDALLIGSDFDVEVDGLLRQNRTSEPSPPQPSENKIDDIVGKHATANQAASAGAPECSLSAPTAAAKYNASSEGSPFPPPPALDSQSPHIGSAAARPPTSHCTQGSSVLSSLQPAVRKVQRALKEVTLDHAASLGKASATAYVVSAAALWAVRRWSADPDDPPPDRGWAQLGLAMALTPALLHLQRRSHPTRAPPSPPYSRTET